MLIKQSAVAAFQRRRFDSWLWLKTLTREQLLDELNKLRVRPQFKTEPWLHQLVCVFVGLYCPKFLFLLDMGLGKTKIILDIATQLVRESRLRNGLIIVPRGINIEAWRDDIALHSNLEAELIDCDDIEEKYERLLRPRGELTVIDLPSLHLALTEKVRSGKKGKGAPRLVPDESRVLALQRQYNLVSLDESHKLTNTEALWFRLSNRLTKQSEFTYATTGTLFGRDPQMIWPQFYLVDRGETFGENMGLFRASFFTAKPNKWGRGEKFEYDKRTADKLHQMIQHRSLRYEESEVRDLPPLVKRAERYTMSDEQRGHYMNAMQGLIDAGGSLEQLDGAWMKMRRIISGYLTWKDEYGEHVLHFAHNPKLDGLESLVERSIDTSKAIVCYDYVETGRMICARLERMGVGHVWLYGGTKKPDEARERFMQDDSVRVIVLNNEIGSTVEGLQKAARYQFLYESPTTPITRKQVSKRMHRHGVEGRSFLYDLVMRKSLDGGILQSLAENEDLYAAVVKGRAKKRAFFLSEYVDG